MIDVQITPVHEGKGRTFRATCLGRVSADSVWESGDSKTARPVWAMFAGSEQELRPFIANLLAGRRVEPVTTRSRHDTEGRFEFLKSVAFRAIWQKEAEGSIVTVYLPPLFELDPGMVDPDGAAFLVMPPAAWAASQIIDTAPIAKHMAAFELPDDLDVAPLVPLAFLFASYLDRRTRYPLLADGRFYLQLLLACLKQGLASWPDTGYGEIFGVHRRYRFQALVEGLGLARPIVFCASHDAIGAMLDEQVAIFTETVANKPAKRKLVRH